MDDVLSRDGILSETFLAAHCIQDKYVEKKLEAEQIRVLLGRHSLKDNSEKGSQTRDVDKIIVHPEWKFEFLKYDADLAILVLDHAVVFSTFIQPACLTDDPELQNENFGTVVCLNFLFVSHDHH